MPNARPDILVVDDDPAIRDTVASLLDMEGYAVRAAQDGDQALALVRAARPALIVLDYYMPRMDGAAFCRALAGEVGRQDTRIVLLTAAGERDVHAIRELCAADALIRKPFDVDDLLDTVARMLPRSA